MGRRAACVLAQEEEAEEALVLRRWRYRNEAEVAEGPVFRRLEVIDLDSVILDVAPSEAEHQKDANNDKKCSEEK